MDEPRTPTTLPSPADRKEFRFLAMDAFGVVWRWIDEEMVWTTAKDDESVGEAGRREAPACHPPVGSGSSSRSGTPTRDARTPRPLRAFDDWCARHGVAHEDVGLMVIAAYINGLTKRRSPATAKQHLASTRSLFTGW